MVKPKTTQTHNLHNHKGKHPKDAQGKHKGEHESPHSRANSEVVGEHEMGIGSALHPVKSVSDQLSNLTSKRSGKSTISRKTNQEELQVLSKVPSGVAVPPNTGLEELGEFYAESELCTSPSMSSVSSYDDDFDINFDPETTTAKYYVTSSGDFINRVLVGNEEEELETQSLASDEFVDMDPALMGKVDEAALSDDEELQHLKRDFEYDLITYIDEDGHFPDFRLQPEAEGMEPGEALPESNNPLEPPVSRSKKKKRLHLDWGNHGLYGLSIPKELKNIKSIDISQNFLKNVKALGLLPVLLKIDASKNEITQFLDIETNDLFPVVQVNFSKNKIATLLNLYHFWALQVVDLSYNRLTYLDRFQQCYYLRVLNVAHNMITDIKNLTCPNLIILNMKDNCIEDISGLIDCPKLVYLNISKNKIKDLSILYELPDLIELRCNNNEIEIMELEKIKVLINLSQLKISPNPCLNIEFARLVVIFTIPQVRVLDGKLVLPEEILEAKNIFNPTPEKLVFEDHANVMIDKAIQSSWTIFDEFVRLHPIPPMLFLVSTPKSNTNDLALRLRDRFKYHIMLGGVHSTVTTVDVGNPNVDIPVSMEGFIELKRRGDLYSTASILGRVCGFSGTQIIKAAERGILLCGTIPLEIALALRKWRFMPKLVLILPSTNPYFNVDDYLKKEKERKESMGSSSSLNESKSGSIGRPKSKELHAIKFSNKTQVATDEGYLTKLSIMSTAEPKRSILKRNETDDLEFAEWLQNSKPISTEHSEILALTAEQDPNIVQAVETNVEEESTNNRIPKESVSSVSSVPTNRGAQHFQNVKMSTSKPIVRKPSSFVHYNPDWDDDDDDDDEDISDADDLNETTFTAEAGSIEGESGNSPVFEGLDSGDLIIQESSSSILDCGEGYFEEHGEDGLDELADELDDSDEDAKSQTSSENKFKHRDALNAAILHQREEYLEFHQSNPGFFATVIDSADLDASFKELEKLAEDLILEFRNEKIDKYPLVQTHAGRNNKNQHFFVEDRIKQFMAQNQEFSRGYSHPLQHRQMYCASSETNQKFKEELPPPNSVLTPELSTKWSDAKIRQLQQTAYHRLEKAAAEQEVMLCKLNDAKEQKKAMLESLNQIEEGKISQIYKQSVNDLPKNRLPNIGYVQQLHSIQSIVRK